MIYTYSILGHISDPVHVVKVMNDTWRGNWDSNPGMTFIINGFQDHLNKPTLTSPRINVWQKTSVIP